MQILFLESVDSTQKYLKDLIKKGTISLPYAVITENQTDGIGSRDNRWKGVQGNLFLSFALPLDRLPLDLKLESASIYFSYLLKETLEEFGSKVWLKWPNDFYLGKRKAGGMITNVIDKTLICGVGINTVEAPQDFAKLDVNVSREELLQSYFKKIKKNILWKQVFSKYKLEFYKNQKFYTHNKNLRLSLKEAFLQRDGSIIVNGERMYSLR